LRQNEFGTQRKKYPVINHNVTNTERIYAMMASNGLIILIFRLIILMSQSTNELLGQDFMCHTTRSFKLVDWL